MSEQSGKKIKLPLAGEQDKWYAGGLHFACSGCGHCCSGAPGYVWLTQQDMQTIAEFLRMDFEAFTRKYVRRVGRDEFSLTEKPGYDCIFLKRENGLVLCEIYAVRPMQCRTWPFWNQNLKNPGAWKQAAGSCPGMRAAEGPLYGLEQIEACRNHPESP